MRRRILIHSGIYTIVAMLLSFPYIYFMVESDLNNRVGFEGQGIFYKTLVGEGSKLAFIVFLSCLVGFIWSKEVGFSGIGNLEDLRRNWQRILVYGAFIGLAVYTFGDRYFIEYAPGFYPTQLKFALFIPFYAALIEEVFARFGVMTILAKIFRNAHIANIIAAFIFAIGHVNMFQVAGIIYRLNYVTACSFILNIGISLFFGYIYWQKGLMTAMAIHFIANLRYVLIALLL